MSDAQHLIDACRKAKLNSRASQQDYPDVFVMTHETQDILRDQIRRQQPWSNDELHNIKIFGIQTRPRYDLLAALHEVIECKLRGERAVLIQLDNSERVAVPSEEVESIGIYRRSLFIFRKYYIREPMFLKKFDDWFLWCKMKVQVPLTVDEVWTLIRKYGT